MREFLGFMSFLCWAAVLYNEVLGVVMPLWRDNTFVLWTALLFAVWSLAWTVRAERQGRDGTPSDKLPPRS